MTEAAQGAVCVPFGFIGMLLIVFLFQKVHYIRTPAMAGARAFSIRIYGLRANEFAPAHEMKTL